MSSPALRDSLASPLRSVFSDEDIIRLLHVSYLKSPTILEDFGLVILESALYMPFNSVMLAIFPYISNVGINLNVSDIIDICSSNMMYFI